MRKLREMPVRTRERKGISRLPPAPHLRPNRPWTASRPRNRSSRGRKSGCPGGSGAWWAGLHSDWLVLGLRAATQGGRCQCPGLWSAGRFLRDAVWNWRFSTEEPDRWRPGPVAHCRSLPRAGTLQVPCPFSSLPPPACERVPPRGTYTHCSLSPHSSDPSSVPTRLTRSPRRLSVLSDAPFLPTRASLCPRSRPGHQERPRPSMVSCFQHSSLSSPSTWRPVLQLLRTSARALIPQPPGDLQLTDRASFHTMRQAPPRSAEPGLEAGPRKHTSPPANTPLVLLAPSCLPTPCLCLGTWASRRKLYNFTEVFYLKSMAGVDRCSVSRSASYTPTLHTRNLPPC